MRLRLFFSVISALQTCLYEYSLQHRRYFVSHDINSRLFGKLPKLVIPYLVTSSVSLYCVVKLRIDISEIMAFQNQNVPSFASIISVLSIVFYCAGFLRVELELHEQNERINSLESVAEAKSLPNDADMKIIKNAPGKCVLSNQEFKSCVTFMKYSHQNFFLSPNKKKKVVKEQQLKQITNEHVFLLAL